MIFATFLNKFFKVNDFLIFMLKRLSQKYITKFERIFQSILVMIETSPCSSSYLRSSESLLPSNAGARTTPPLMRIAGAASSNAMHSSSSWDMSSIVRSVVSRIKVSLKRWDFEDLPPIINISFWLMAQITGLSLGLNSSTLKSVQVSWAGAFSLTPKLRNSMDARGFVPSPTPQMA